MTAREVPPNPLISELTDHIRTHVKTVKAPAWSLFVKTGTSRQRPPDDPNWWYTRAASLLRKVCLNQPIGVGELRSFYGGRADLGVAPDHRRKGGGSSLRIILQQLEAGGLVQK
ncbi:MAG: 40S ribosomal protein S19, partial [Candidatus Geothermarchaeales archaeon]